LLIGGDTSTTILSVQKWPTPGPTHYRGFTETHHNR